MSQKHQKGQARSISVNAIAEKPLLIWDYVAFAAIAVFCFLVFQQSDLLHTAGCSYGYLNGHFRDFYDYCGTFDIHPAYMPSFYLIFAIWNIPMRLFGIVTSLPEWAARNQSFVHMHALLCQLLFMRSLSLASMTSS